MHVEEHDSADPVAMYLREVAKVKPLTKDEEAALFQQLGRWGDWDEKGENAARRLIESQLALVVSIADRYSSAGIPTLELIQEGNLGLMNAVRTFAEMPAGEFSEHASASIEDAILKAVGHAK
jgi:DNA-directed RNA polymerase sigma subunit (sigma70/sigma32)